jgi:hypothetical protein
VASSPCIAASVDSATVTAGRDPEAETSADDDPEAEADGGPDSFAGGTEVDPGPMTTIGARTDTAAVCVTGGSGASGSIRSVASSSLTSGMLNDLDG